MSGPAPATASVAQLLKPRSVAVIGASEDQTKFGGRLYRMLIKHGFDGTIYPINPGRESVFGIKTYPSVAVLPEAPDMVVMALPREKVKAEIQASAARGARGSIIITAKFSDAGDEGAALEREIVSVARAGGMRLIGPNCLGIISPANKLVLCSSPALDVDTLPVGAIGLISQSGALMATVFDRALDIGVGFSHCVSVGNQADLELCDFVEYLIDDERTQVVCTYIEGIKDPVRFVALARRAREAGKPWLAVKAGRTEAGSKAAFSHTASIAGSHAVLAAVCGDENITLLDDPGTMITLAAVLARHPNAMVERIAVLTTSGGGGALASDAITTHGLAMAQFAPATHHQLDQIYSPGQAQNPVDFGGRKFENAADIAGVTARIVTADPNTDALLFAITTAPMLRQLSEDLVDGITDAQEREAKPAFFVMQPGRAADTARDALRQRGIPFTNYTGEAIDALAAWGERSRYRLRLEAQRPAACAEVGVGTLRGEFDEAASKALLGRYGVPVNASHIVHNSDAAMGVAKTLGYPVVLKIVSPDIVHKSDVGGVAIGLADEAMVAAAYQRIVDSAKRSRPRARIDGVSVQAMVGGKLELILGARRDPQFGPIVVFGAGGVLVELLPARVVARAPIAATDARRELENLPVWPVLAGHRGRPLAVDAVVDAIVRTSWLAHDLGDTDFELDLNPLIVSEVGCCAVDARLRIADRRSAMASD